MNRESIGLFGGTFDPPHVGHLALAEAAARQFKLKRVLWELAPVPPHKTGRAITPLEHRLAMLQRAVAGNPRFEISYLEINRPGPHYTVDTVKALAALYPQAEITLLLGEDSLRGFSSWRKPELILRFVRRVATMRRAGDPFDLDALFAQVPGLKEKLRFLQAPPRDISSSELRARIAQGDDCRDFLPPAVREYIEAHGLYQK